MAGWLEDTVLEDGVAPPTLRTLLAAYEHVFAEIGYEGEARNIGRGFATRLEALLIGAKGRALDTMSGFDFAALLSEPVVIELKSVIDADESAVFTSFIIDRIREEAVRRGNSGGTLVHVTVIEEAQQILGAQASSRTAPGVTDTRAAAVQSFANAVSTLRALGEGIVMSTQRPSELHPQAIANTSNRIVLHLEEEEDRGAVLSAFDADGQVAHIASRLHEGEALVRWPGREDAEVVAILPVDGVNTRAEVSDEVVATHMATTRESVTRLLPYQLCTLSVCTTGCEPRRRETGSRVAAYCSADAERAWAHAARDHLDPTDLIAEVIAPHAGRDLPSAYCVAAHLAAKDVIKVDPHRDVREHIAASLAKVINANE
jgi:hypothetical protein